MKTFTEEIVIDRTRATVYEHLTRFEEYPAFIESAEEVERLADDRLRWRMEVGPISREYEAELTEERPDELIAWRAMADDVKEAGEIRLEDAGPDQTKVRFSIAYDLDSVLLKTADAIGVVERRTAGDLQRLKAHIEDR
jgi:uncharacterized membrane protein